MNTQFPMRIFLSQISCSSVEKSYRRNALIPSWPSSPTIGPTVLMSTTSAPQIRKRAGQFFTTASTISKRRRNTSQYRLSQSFERSSISSERFISNARRLLKCPRISRRTIQSFPVWFWISGDTWLASLGVARTDRVESS